MKRRLTIDIGAVHVDFIVVEQRDDIVDVRMIDGMEHDVIAHLLDLTNHCLNNLNNIIIKITKITRHFFSKLNVKKLKKQRKLEVRLLGGQ